MWPSTRGVLACKGGDTENVTRWVSVTEAETPRILSRMLIIEYPNAIIHQAESATSKPFGLFKKISLKDPKDFRTLKFKDF